MSAAKESPSGLGGWWLLILAPVLYLALFFPLTSATARIGAPALPFWGWYYIPLQYAPYSVSATVGKAWARMDPEGARLAGTIPE